MMIRPVVIALLALGLASACASTTSQPAPKPAPRSEPVRQPTPTVQSAPAALPKTASPLPLIGWTGVAALGLGGAVRATRRRL